MATTPKTTIGTMHCLCCGHQIPVKTAENGTINAACAWCDFPAYAKRGTQAHRLILAKTTLNEPATAPAPAPAATKQPPAPAAKPAPTAPTKTAPAGPFHGL